MGIGRAVLEVQVRKVYESAFNSTIPPQTQKPDNNNIKPNETKLNP